MISNLVLGEADLIGTCLAMNEVRARAVDYVLPSSHHHYAIVIDKESEARRMSWDHLLRPFSPGIWAAIGVCVAGAATTITIWKVYYKFVFYLLLTFCYDIQL